MSVSFLQSAWDALKKIGAIVAWPFKHEQQIQAVFDTVKTDLPPTVLACKQLAQLFVAMGPDVLAVVASKGFDLPEDVKSAIDLKGIAAFAKDTLIPTIERDFTDVKLAVEGKSTAPLPFPAQPAGSAATADPVSPSEWAQATGGTPIVTGGGAHTQVPA